MKFRKRPVVIDAVQWFLGVKVDGVIPYSTPEGQSICQYCGKPRVEHGWIETLEGGHIVCSGDWIITGVVGEHYPIKNSIFQETYEPVNDFAKS